jgi:type I restriction enzyme S subunit
MDRIKKQPRPDSMKPHPANPVHPVKIPWPTVRLGEVLTRSDETIEPETDTEYREITVKLWGKGVIERGRVTGAEISGRRFVARTGQFIASRIDARNGAMGLVPASLNGALVTNDFPLFHLNAKRLEPAFLGWLCRTADFVELCLRASEGTTNRVRLKENSFLALEIPLPPLAEQRRVVARIEALAAQIQEARTLRRQAAEEAEALLLSKLGAVFSREVEQRGTTRLEGLLVDAGYGSSEKCNAERVEEATPVLRIPNVASERINLTDMKYARLNKRDSEKLLLSEGDVLVVRTNGSLELVGRSAVVPKLEEPFAFASYMIRLRFDRKRIAPDYAQRMMQYLRVAGVLVDFARTTAGQYNVSLGRLRAAEIPVPPLTEQRRIVAELDALQAEVDALKRLQAGTAVELDALLPAILDRAFKGEL